MEKMGRKYKEEVGEASGRKETVKGWSSETEGKEEQVSFCVRKN